MMQVSEEGLQIKQAEEESKVIPIMVETEQHEVKSSVLAKGKLTKQKAGVRFNE